MKVAARNEEILLRMQALKGEHPFWGYRRVWAWLRYGEGLVVNKKRILRLMQAHRLTVRPGLLLRARRTSGRPKPRPAAPNRCWGIDMTKVLVAGSGWLYLVIAVDWYTKKIVGWEVSERSKTSDWLQALEMGLARQFPDGVRGKGLMLVSDNGCQPTSQAFMKACGTLGIRQVFTSYGNPRGNADTERMIRTLKEECLWLREWRSAAELIQALGAWIEGYNGSYLHSALGYRSPLQFEAEHKNGLRTHLNAA